MATEWLSSLLERVAVTAPPAPPPPSTPFERLLALNATATERVVALALAFLLLVALLFPRLASWRRWRASPGPPAPSFLLGHAPQLNNPRAPMALLEYAEKYGPIFRLRLAHRRAVVVACPRAFAQLTKRGAHERLPKDEAIYAPLNVGIEGRPRSLLTEPRDSPAWSCVRKAIAPAFSASALKTRVFPPLVGLLEQAVAHLKSEHARLVAQGGGKQSAELDVESLSKMITADVIHVLLFSEPLGGTAAFCACPLPAPGTSGTPEAALAAEKRAMRTADALLANPSAPVSAEDYVSLVEALLETARRALGNPLRRPFAPLLRLLGDRDAEADARLEKAFAGFMSARVAKLESPEGAPPDGSIASAILNARDSSTGELLPTNRRCGELSVIVNAGFETSSRSIVCTLAALAEHPDAQEKLAAELAAAGLSPSAEEKAPPGVRPLAWADLSPSALPYLHAVTRECLRLYPPAALGSGRVVASSGGEDICGMHVPEGTVVMLPSYVASRLKSAYGPDACEFRPERWMPNSPSSAAEATTETEGGEGVEKQEQQQQLAPLPEPPTFSFGPRDCVGQPLARAELLAAVAALVGAFRWRPAQRVVDGGGLEGLLHFRITLGTESGMPLLFEPR